MIAGFNQCDYATLAIMPSKGRNERNDANLKSYVICARKITLKNPLMAQVIFSVQTKNQSSEGERETHN